MNKAELRKLAEQAIEDPYCLNDEQMAMYADCPVIIRELLDEMEAMQCCGNCINYVQHCQEGYKAYDMCSEWEWQKGGASEC